MYVRGYLQGSENGRVVTRMAEWLRLNHLVSSNSSSRLVYFKTKFVIPVIYEGWHFTHLWKTLFIASSLDPHS